MVPKPLNPSIGVCPCSMRGCDHTAEVKKEKGKRARLYLVCQAHGVINLGGFPFQNYILEHATINGAEPVPARLQKLPTQTGQATATLDLPAADKYHSVKIEQGPAPEPYPAGVSLAKPKPKPAPAPAPAHSPEPKPAEKGGGFRPFGWLTDGLSEL